MSIERRFNLIISWPGNPFLVVQIPPNFYTVRFRVQTTWFPKFNAASIIPFALAYSSLWSWFGANQGISLIQIDFLKLFLLFHRPKQRQLFMLQIICLFRALSFLFVNFFAGFGMQIVKCLLALEVIGWISWLPIFN